MATATAVQHTPGPWAFGHIDGFIRDCRNQKIARIEYGLPTEQMQSNGYVVQAAPDLLAALKGLLDEASPESIAAAEAAIARAEGRE